MKRIAMKKLFTICLLFSLYAPAGYSFFGSVSEDIPLFGADDANSGSSGAELSVVNDTEYSGKPTERLETVSCSKITNENVPLKMINALRHSSRDKMKVDLKYDQDSGSYKVSVKFPYMMTDCFEPSINIKRYSGNFVVEVKNKFFKGRSPNDKLPTMKRYEQCLSDKGILVDGKIKRDKASFGTYAVSEHEVALSDIFDGKSKIDHIEALFASPKETPREFLTAFSNMSADQPDNCFNMEYFGGMKQDLLSKKQLAEHRFEWICDGNGNVLDVDELLTSMPRNVGNYNTMIKDLEKIKESLKEEQRSSNATALREKLKEAVRLMKKGKSGDRYAYEMAVNDYYTILSKLEEKDIKPLLDELVSLKDKMKKAKGAERAKISRRLRSIENDLRFYNRFITVDIANSLAKGGFYDEAKFTYMMKLILDKRSNANKKVSVGKNKKGKKRSVVLDSYEDFFDYAELTFDKKTRAKYKEYQKVFQIKEEGASYADESYDKAKDIAKGADKRYNSFMEKMNKSCEKNFFGYAKDKSKCEKYQKQWKKESARRSEGYKIAGKYLGDSKKYSELEGDREDDDEFDDDPYDADTFYQANALGSYQRYGTSSSSQTQNPFGSQQTQNPFGTQQYGMPQQYNTFGQTQYGMPQQYNTFGQTQYGMPQQYNTFGQTQYGMPQQYNTFGQQPQYNSLGQQPMGYFGQQLNTPMPTPFGTQPPAAPVFR